MNSININDLQINQEDKKRFEDLLNTIGVIKPGILMSATVAEIDKQENIHLDLGLKSRGVITKNEFISNNNDTLPAIGDTVTVLLEKLEDEYGNVVVSYVKALRQSLWGKLLEIYNKRESVKVKVLKLITGGCEVNILGVTAFVPKAHFPIGIKDFKEIIGNEYSANIIKLDELKSSIIVSLKNNIENDAILNFSEGQIVEGIIKDVKESYAIVQIDSYLARLNISEISWEHINNIFDVLKKDQKIEAKVINTNGSRVFVSMKALTVNPWIAKIKERNIQVGKIVDAKVVFIEENQIICKYDEFEIRLKITETAWMKKYQTFDGYKKNDIIKMKIKLIDENKNKIHASVKDLEEHPVKSIEKKYNIGDKIAVEITGNSELGYIAKIDKKIDGIVPLAATYLYGSLSIGEKTNLYLHSTSVENMQIILGNRKPN